MVRIEEVGKHPLHRGDSSVRERDHQAATSCVPYAPSFASNDGEPCAVMGPCHATQSAHVVTEIRERDQRHEARGLGLPAGDSGWVNPCGPGGIEQCAVGDPI